MEQIRRIMRPTDVPDMGMLCDLLWADPDKEVIGWGRMTEESPSHLDQKLCQNFWQNMTLILLSDQIKLAHPLALIPHFLFSAIYPPSRWLKMDMNFLQSDSW